MKIDRARLVEGSELPIPEGDSRPARCLLRLEDDKVVAAVLKRIDAEAVAVECFCALMLRGWGLHVPQPFLVDCGDGVMAFASADEGYPNLKQSIGFDDELPADVRRELREQAAGLVRTFSQTPLAIAADEALLNRDRHLGNILWDGARVAWIDHAGCFGLSQEEDRNRLVSLICLAPDHEEIRDRAMSSADAICRAPMPPAATESDAYFDQYDYAGPLATNLERLAQKVLARFPQPTDLFADVSGSN